MGSHALDEDMPLEEFKVLSMPGILKPQPCHAKQAFSISSEKGRGAKLKLYVGGLTKTDRGHAAAGKEMRGAVLHRC